MTPQKFYKEVLGAPKHILAPMVEQSELAFRMMSRQFGSELCYTPMWHAGIFVRDAKYRNDAIETAPKDRPLLFQFCANDPETFANACALAEPHCDGVDLNLGCPQMIAHRGHYGAFLMEEWELIEKMIKTACERITKPVTCKIRIYESIEKTIEYVKRLEKAGAQIITVHGRMREQRGPMTGIANWEHIKAVKENVSVPVFANGNIQYLRDVEECIKYTKVDGVMSAEGALYNPAIFTGRQPPAWEMADLYLQYCDKYKPALGTVRGHLFRMWHHCLSKHTELRLPMGTAKNVEQLKTISNTLKEKVKADAQIDIDNGNDSEEIGKLPYWRCQPYVRPKQKNASGKRTLEEGEQEKKKDKLLSKKKLMRQKQYERGKGVFPNTPKDKWPICVVCKANPWGAKCSYNRCKKCCKITAEKQVQDCPGHRFYYHSNLVVNPRTDTATKGMDKKIDNKLEKDCCETKIEKDVTTIGDTNGNIEINGNGAEMHGTQNGVTEVTS